MPAKEISPNRTSSPKPTSPIRRLFQSKQSVSQLHKSVGGNEVERVFRYIDGNGDGKISAEELKWCIRAVAGGKSSALTDEEAQAAVRDSDSDGDGYLSVGDLEKIMAAKEVPEEQRTEELREAFAMYEDTAGSGRLTARSLRKMMSRLGEAKSVRDCQVMINRFDLDGDGVISFEEFAAMMG